MNPQVLTTTKSVPSGSIDQLVSFELQQAQHPFAVDEVLRTTQADKRVAAFGGVVASSRVTAEVPS